MAQMVEILNAHTIKEQQSFRATDPEIHPEIHHPYLGHIEKIDSILSKEWKTSKEGFLALWTDKEIKKLTKTTQADSLGIGSYFPAVSLIQTIHDCNLRFANQVRHFISDSWVKNMIYLFKVLLCFLSQVSTISSQLKKKCKLQKLQCRF